MIKIENYQIDILKNEVEIYDDKEIKIIDLIKKEFVILDKIQWNYFVQLLRGQIPKIKIQFPCESILTFGNYTLFESFCDDIYIKYYGSVVFVSKLTFATKLSVLFINLKKGKIK